MMRLSRRATLTLSLVALLAALGVDVTEDARQHSRQLVEQSMHGRMDEASSEACSLIAPAASRQPAPRVE